MLYLLKGLVLGVLVAAPVGPLGVLCIRRSISFGMASGFYIGLAVAAADAFYGAVVAFGLKWISDSLMSIAGYLQVGGGAVLIWVSLSMMRNTRPIRKIRDRNPSRFRAFFAVFFLTLSNPATILSFVAIFATFNLANMQTSYFSASLLTFGIFVGSAGWWLFLSWITSKHQDSLTDRSLRKINFAAGLMLLIFAVFGLVRGIQSFQL